jgi:glycosyltransferase involved in cell wall biosynthesis
MNYSIIIPHKNIPDLLKRCLDSIPRRDDVQIIIVDDNSDPAIVDFNQFPGMGDPHTEVIFTKEGKGAGYARNVGLTKATGKWILFADADDFFNYCINDILDDYINSDADIIYCKHICLDSDRYTVKRRCVWFNTYIDYWQYVPQRADPLLRYKHMSPWAKIIKKDIITANCILFDEIPMSNDVTFSYLAGYHAHSVQADPRALYCTTIREGSIRQSKMTDEKELARFYVGAKRYRFFREHHVPIPNGISFITFFTRSRFFNKNCRKKAKDILLNLGFTSAEISMLCICDAFAYFPRRISARLFPNYTFFPWLFLTYKKVQRKIKK